MTVVGNALKSLVFVLVVWACLLGGAPSTRAATTTYTSPYAGGTINPGDTVVLDNGATITGAITDNGTLQFNQTSGTLTMSSALTGSGTLSLTNAGTLMLTGTTVSTGIGLDMTTTVDSGRLLIGNNGGRSLYLGNTNGGVGTLSINSGYVGNGTSYLGYGAGGQASVTVSSGTWSNGSFTYVGWDGSATLDVTGGGSVSGVVGSIGRNAGSVGSVTVSGGTMSFSSNLTVADGGTGSLTIGNGGLVVVKGNVVRGASGTISLNAGGTLQIGTGTNTGVLLGGSGTLANNGTVVFNRSNASTYTGVLSGSGAVTKLGLGTLTLSGSNGYTGATAVNGGVLAYGASNVLSDSTAVTVAGGSVDLGSSTDTVASFTITSGSLFGSGKLTAATYALGGGTVTGNLGGGSMTVTANSGLIGTADVTSVSLNAGGLTLGSAGRFTSNQVAITGSSGGNLSLGGNESVGSLAGGFNVALGSATLTTGNDNTSTTYSGILSSSGGLTKAGTGTLTLSGSSSYTGATAVDGGKLLVNGQLGNTAVAVNASGLLGGSGTILGDVTVASSGTLAPGNSPGVLTVGSLSLLAGSHTAMEITGTSASLYDQVFGTGSGGLTYGGTLDLVMSGMYADQTVFNLFSNFSLYTGNFAAVGLDATGEYAGLTFSDMDGVWTSTETANNQRLVFSTTTGNLSVLAAVVPEPSTCAMALAGLACGGLQMWRRRRLKAAL